MALNLVPQVGQNLANTQQPILDNFTDINNNFAVDHVAFNSGADSGKHAKITFPITVALPVYANPNETGLYGFLNGTSNKQEINVFKSLAFGFANTDRVPITLQRGNLAAQTLENYDFAGTANTVQLECSNYSYLPSGILMQWMVINTTAGASTNNYNFPIPFSNKVFNVQMTLLGAVVKDNFRLLTPTSPLSAVTIQKVGSGSSQKILIQAVGI